MAEKVFPNVNYLSKPGVLKINANGFAWAAKTTATASVSIESEGILKK